MRRHSDGDPNQETEFDGFEDAFFLLLLIAETLLPDVVAGTVGGPSNGAIVAAYEILGASVGSFETSLFLSSNGLTIDTPASPLASATTTGNTVGAHTVTLAAPTTPIPAGASLLVWHDALVDTGGEPVLEGAIAEASESNNVFVLHEAQVEPAAGSESAGSVQFPVVIPATNGPVVIQYETADDPSAEHPAVAGVDYTSVSGTLTFAPGETTAHLDVPPLVRRARRLLENFARPAKMVDLTELAP